MEASILIVEDDEKLARFTELELLHEGYKVDKVYNGRDAAAAALEKDYSLILLDIMLPGLNGLEVLRRINKEKQTPVILLTARDAVMDKVAGLDAGAVDYITKPFAIEELLARIRVALKHFGGGEGKQMVISEEGFSWGDLFLDVPRHRVTFKDDDIILTNREFILLETLLSNQDIVMSRDALLLKVCGYEYVGETNVIDVYVRYIRSKIDEVYKVKMIETVRGVGYVIRSRH